MLGTMNGRRFDLPPLVRQALPQGKGDNPLTEITAVQTTVLARRYGHAFAVRKTIWPSMAGDQARSSFS